MSRKKRSRMYTKAEKIYNFLQHVVDDATDIFPGTCAVVTIILFHRLQDDGTFEDEAAPAILSTLKNRQEDLQLVKILLPQMELMVQSDDDG